MAEMTIFGALRNAISRQKALSPVPQRGGWWRIHEPFTGAWQMNKEEDHGNVLTYPTLYACIARIAKDIGKLPFVLKQRGEDGIWKPITNAAYSPVLRKPNHYQTAQQFREYWLLTKLTQGNAYLLKQRDNRGVVTSLYPLDPFRVKPLVSDSGAVYYELQTSNLNLIPENGSPLIVPARDIIHDREMCPFHPLIGVPPLAAANWAVVKNLRIMRSSAEFFANGAQPSGILTAPGQISDETATRLSEYWNANFSGDKSGKVAVVGDDLKYTPMAMTSTDAQLVEQLKYSDEQIAQPFGIPPFKIGIGSIPAGLKADDINIMYHNDALSDRIEAMEDLLDEALALPQDLGIWQDTDPLFRMDEGKKAEVETKLVGGGVKTPNEGRSKFGLVPLEGGDTVYMQQQDFPLDQVRKNKIVDAEQNPVPAEELPPSDDDETKAALILAQTELNTMRAANAFREAMHV